MSARIASFIKKYHKGEDAVFWPDLASVHYSKRSLEEMERLRSIESFWANLKHEIYSHNFVGKLKRN